ncbi:hypothetical protein B0T26DRAFT_659576 [Lasiosphaeria miniovina]|uniref:Uncharacterized protein n=1 Tax=Lasiosphaeria miniovina TaxID=1954250 RepID=A0AA39ZQP7_9PEZI|nr:uncharacterized protein B0T26DRAFT_659576 [Lasiosphaeria miniovina]KAK0701799.1 hypothetical protein B0T26DRAFT_659576 [Lasiosphaeria miniovina]
MPSRTAVPPDHPEPPLTQHQRLVLEQLPFKTLRSFHDWLDSVYVRGSWEEFLTDFLVHNPMAPEPDKARVASLAIAAVSSRNPRYTLYHPKKKSWAVEDHHIRFIVTVIMDNRRLWDDAMLAEQGEPIARAVYEVLSYYRASVPRRCASPRRCD